jgi:hypothetical protein
VTTLIAWAGVDDRGVTSLNLASDSRISWPTGGKWDYAQKVFVPASSSEIIGYCGDVLYAVQTISQFVQRREHGFAQTNSTGEVRFKELSTALREGFDTYPPSEQRTFDVLYCAREAAKRYAFSAFKLSWEPVSGWTETALCMPKTSGVLCRLGSGRSHFKHAYDKWAAAGLEGTSRAVFGALCDHLTKSKDPGSGGAPQLASIFNEGDARMHGVIFRDQRFVCGAPSPAISGRGLEWRNELFERSDPATLRRLPDAQPQPRPFKL